MPDPEPRRTEYVDLDTIRPAPRNAKRHTDLGPSFDEFGYIDAVIIDERTGLLIGGHGRTEKLAELRTAGSDPPDGIRVEDGRWLIPVQRGWSSRDDRHAEAAGIALNRLTELGGWDDRLLVEMLSDFPDTSTMLNTVGFSPTDMEHLLMSVAAEDAADGSPPTDDIPDIPENPVSKLGDVWMLGDHRLICGDSSDVAVLDRLHQGAKIGALLTDPPYGINLDTDWSSLTGNEGAILKGVPGGKYRSVEGDSRPFDAAPIRSYYAGTKEQFWFGGDYYRRTLSDDDRDGCYLVWDKRNEASDPGIGSGFELIWSPQRHKRDLLRVYWFGAFGPADARHRMHPTQKPIDLLVAILTRWTPEGCLVADPYAGSGTTLIAAERTSRVAHIAEIDPAYCDVILARWEAMTGRQSIQESTGLSYIETRDQLDGRSVTGVT